VVCNVAIAANFPISSQLGAIAVMGFSEDNNNSNATFNPLPNCILVGWLIISSLGLKMCKKYL